MSERERPELAAFAELETIVHRLSEELAGFRRRALTAEARLRELDGAGEGGASLDELSALRDRVEMLERENGTLRGRLDSAAGRTRQMLDRVHFLRQQAQAGGDRGGDR
ncbi:MAG TPA: hypothetical protein VEA99_09515 [Gemmatimonadaceae bacterium]|nr:hypothetical protein [Gemmatimonadaceae bacterium]